jgi:hypothetical protein
LKRDEAAFFLEFAGRSQDNVRVFGFYINAFFAAATSIRVGKGVMNTEYRDVRGFTKWFQKARENLNVKFPKEFWVEMTRNGVIHREGNLGNVTRRRVTARVIGETRGNGSIWVRRSDPPADNRLRFAEGFDESEGGKVIVNRCRDYLDALTEMIDEWENTLG